MSVPLVIILCLAILALPLICQRIHDRPRLSRNHNGDILRVQPGKPNVIVARVGSAAWKAALQDEQGPVAAWPFPTAQMGVNDADGVSASDSTPISPQLPAGVQPQGNGGLK